MEAERLESLPVNVPAVGPATLEFAFCRVLLEESVVVDVIIIIIIIIIIFDVGFSLSCVAFLIYIRRNFASTARAPAPLT